MGGRRKLQPGDRVKVGVQQHPALVLKVGGCTFKGCPNPKTCVEVQEDRHSSPTNWRAYEVTR